MGGRRVNADHRAKSYFGLAAKPPVQDRTSVASDAEKIPFVNNNKLFALIHDWFIKFPV
jgi:hypothetical protein